MAKGIVLYYSRSGNTKEMAEIIAEAMNATGLATECRSVEKTHPDDLPEYDAIVIGSPCYYGQMAAPVKHLIDELVGRHGQLNGKVGAAFASSCPSGGSENSLNFVAAAIGPGGRGSIGPRGGVPLQRVAVVPGHPVGRMNA